MSTLSKFFHAHAQQFGLLAHILEDAAVAALPGPAGAAITKAVADVTQASKSLHEAAAQIPEAHTDLGQVVANAAPTVIEEAIQIGMAAIAARGNKPAT